MKVEKTPAERLEDVGKLLDKLEQHIDNMCSDYTWWIDEWIEQMRDAVEGVVHED